jgi:aspartate ammonia-lyase
MPGKINPVLPMMMQQVAFAVTGNDLAVSMAALQGQLEINHFEPIMASRLFESLDLLTNGTRLFIERCIEGVAVNRETSWRNLLESSVLAAVFVAALGYEATAALVKQSLEQKRPLSALAVESRLLTEGDIVASLYRSAGAPAPREWRRSAS